MVIYFDAITIGELMQIDIGRIDGDRGFLIIGKESQNDNS